jgi:hypothetical protein
VTRTGSRGSVLVLLLTGCATTTLSATKLPQFRGVEDETWLAQESETAGRSDLLPAFEQSASSYGCVTDHIGAESTQNMHGELRGYYGVSAACREGNIALITVGGGRVRIGCTKPTTLEACDRLLQNIVQARD